MVLEMEKTISLND